MPTQRLPLAHNIATRDGTLNKDAKVGNAFIEVSQGENVAIVKRPGLVTYQSATAGEDPEAIQKSVQSLFEAANPVFAKKQAAESAKAEQPAQNGEQTVDASFTEVDPADKK